MLRPTTEVVRGVTVVRDDLIEGGTKRPALAEVLPAWKESEFAFPASSSGIGQLALALAARDVGKQATLFVAQRGELTKETKAARAAGANIVQVPNGRYSVVQKEARDYAAKRGALYLPPGFDHPDFAEAVTERARLLNMEPTTVVVTVSSGTLCRALQHAWPSASFVAVKVGMRPRLEANAVVVKADEEYTQIARMPPPFPSASYQDAKAWRYCQAGWLFWNIAGNVKAYLPNGHRPKNHARLSA